MSSSWSQAAQQQSSTDELDQRYGAVIHVDADYEQEYGKKTRAEQQRLLHHWQTQLRQDIKDEQLILTRVDSKDQQLTFWVTKVLGHSLLKLMTSYEAELCKKNVPSTSVSSTSIVQVVCQHYQIIALIVSPNVAQLRRQTFELPSIAFKPEPCVCANSQMSYDEWIEFEKTLFHDLFVRSTSYQKQPSHTHRENEENPDCPF